MIFPTTNTCPNTLPYLYDVHSWAEYASYFVTMFLRRISMLGQFPLHKQGTSCKNQPALDSGHRACHVVGPSCQYNAWEPRAVQLHGMHNDQNLTPVDFYMKSLVYTEGIGRGS
uniref:SFRICE_029294 n=1 Tax=Spodoptera frugiperda TaxID=7108 RepID=A0A2H1WKJ4_SPOFR